MKRISTSCCLILLLVDLSLQASLATDLFYNAGVVEFRPSTNLTNAEKLADNLNGFLDILASQEAEALDIIVFPESALNSNNEYTFVPNPQDGLTVPCDFLAGEYHNILVTLSCAARNHSKYVVINLTEKELCSAVPEDKRPCASSGLNIFNTNVVFDRTGAVISRYRKVHLYGENKNVTYKPEFGWFDTDFGVRFGHFICFDIVFYSPAQELVDKYQIKDFIFTSMWFSQLPFLTAVQLQQAWSYANDVNLLAAGVSNPARGSTGTGIYHGDNGALVAKMSQGAGERMLYTARVPKYPVARQRSRRSIAAASPRLTKPDIFLKRDYLENFDTVLIDLYNQSALNQQLCFKNTTFCCRFNLKWRELTPQEKSGQHYLYRLGVYEGLRNENAHETNAIKTCALFSCMGSDILDCGKLGDIDTDVMFENITITANLPITKTYLVMPNSLKVENLMPVPTSDFEFQHAIVASYYKFYRYNLIKPTPNLMAFAIYGNYYDSYAEKPDTNEGDGAATMAVSLFAVLFLVLVQTIL